MSTIETGWSSHNRLSMGVMNQHRIGLGVPGSSGLMSSLAARCQVHGQQQRTQASLAAERASLT